MNVLWTKRLFDDCWWIKNLSSKSECFIRYECIFIQIFQLDWKWTVTWFGRKWLLKGQWAHFFLMPRDYFSIWFVHTLIGNERKGRSTFFLLTIVQNPNFFFFYFYPFQHLAFGIFPKINEMISDAWLVGNEIFSPFYFVIRWNVF